VEGGRWKTVWDYPRRTTSPEAEVILVWAF
jgi:hypothetical protein